jgi:hypothetical protein
MAHNKYVFSWIEEATEGVRVRDVTPADTQAWLFGILTEPLFQIPHPVADGVQRWVYDSWDLNSQDQGGLTVPHTFSFIMLNAIELYFALGNSINTAPSFEQHVIEGINSGHLPTRTFHYEATGGTTPLILDAVGRKTVGLELQCARGSFPFLTAKLTTVGARGQTSKQAIFDNNLAGALQAYEYTTNGAGFPNTPNNSPYMFDENYTCTWDTVAESTLHSWKLSILTPTVKIEQNDVVADDYGVVQARWPWYNFETGKRHYMMSLILHQDDRNLWDDYLDALTNKSLDTMFKRRDNPTTSRDDELFFEMDNCQIKSQEIRMPRIAETGVYEVMILPKTVKATVKDEIDSDGSPNFYGG